MKSIKAGYLTTEFWTMVVGVLTTLFLKFSGMLPDTYAVILGALLIGAYAVSRGLAKLGPGFFGGKKFYLSTEFWAVASGAGYLAFEFLKGGIEAQWVAPAATILGAAYNLSRGMSKNGDPLSELAGKTGGQLLGDIRNNARVMWFIVLIGGAGLMVSCVSVPAPPAVPFQVGFAITGPSGDLWSKTALPILAGQEVTAQDSEGRTRVFYLSARDPETGSVEQRAEMISADQLENRLEEHATARAIVEAQGTEAKPDESD